jgi:hypothetical protein
LDVRVTDDVFNGEDVDLGERVEVAADGGVPAAAGFGVVAEEVAAFLVEALVESRLEAATGVVDWTWCMLVVRR